MLQCSDALRGYIAECILTRMYTFHPSELVYFGIEYNIRKLFERGFIHLCDIPPTQLKGRHCLRLRPDILAAYIQVVGRKDEHRRMVAAEPPEMQHCNACQDLTGCSEDWRAVWWNGMGRLLLDGRKPHTFEEAIDHFKTLRFGRVTEGCKQHMFNSVIDISIPGAHSSAFVARIRDQLVAKHFSRD